MSKQFSFLNFDPIIGTDIMNLVGADATKLAVPSFFKRVSDIVAYFGSKPDYRYQILKLLSSKPLLYTEFNTKGDKVDSLWTYVQLQNEKAAKLKEFEPKDFGEDVAKEIVSGHLTIDKKKRINQDIENQKTLLEKRSVTAQNEQKEGKAMDGVMALPKLTRYQQTLRELEILDKELSQFT